MLTGCPRFCRRRRRCRASQRQGAVVCAAMGERAGGGVVEDRGWEAAAGHAPQPADRLPAIVGAAVQLLVSRPSASTPC
ncbi:hypothetical protein ACPA9J_07690 [Pseudomonas aeruginosa]